MKYLILGLLFLLVTGCEYTIVKNSDIEAEKSQDFFEKNKECYSYKDEVQKDYNEGIKIPEVYLFSGPFYSSKTNSCIFAEAFSTSFAESKSKIRSCSLIDVMTREIYEDSGEYYNDVLIQEICEKIVEKYKNE